MYVGASFLHFLKFEFDFTFFYFFSAIAELVDNAIDEVIILVIWEEPNLT